MKNKLILVAVIATVLATAGCQAPAEPADSLDSSSLESVPCVGSDPGGELNPLVISANASVSALPYLSWARDSGCFEAHGLDVTIESSSADAFTKLAGISGGSVDISVDAMVELVGAMTSDSFRGRIRIVSHGYGFSEKQLDDAMQGALPNGDLAIESVLLARPGSGLDSLDDLAGKKVGSSTGGNNVIGLQLALQEQNIPLEEVELIRVSAQERVVAFEKGDVDFAILTGQMARDQLARGAKVVLYPGAYVYQPGSVMAFYSLSDVVEAKPRELAAFQRAMEEVNSWLSEPNNLAAFKDYLATEFEMDSESAQSFVMPNFTLGIPDQALVESYANFLYEHGIIESAEVGPNVVWLASEK